MALLSKQQSALAGAVITFGAAAGGGDTIKANERSILLVTNGDSSSHTVTIAIPGNTDFGQAQPDVAVVVAAGVTKAIGPFARGVNDPSDGLVHITYSAVTSVTVAHISA